MGGGVDDVLQWEEDQVRDATGGDGDDLALTETLRVVFMCSQGSGRGQG